MNQTTRMFLILGLCGGVGYLLWTQYRKNNIPTDKDVEQSAQKTTQQAVALERQANNTAEMAAKAAYARAQAQVGAQRYAAGGIAYPQFAPSTASQVLQARVPMAGGGHL